MSPYLREVFGLPNTNMDRLAGIEPNQFRIYGGPDEDFVGDEIDTVMALASVNTELLLAQRSGCEDSSTTSPVGHVLKAKAERTVGGTEAFTTLREIAGIPDVGDAVLEKRLPLERLIRLRQSRDGEQFRLWFHEHCRNDLMGTAREYVALLRDLPRIQSFSSRVMRFIVTTAIGLIPGVGPVAGPVADAIDSFFLDKLRAGGSPKFFIDNLRQLQREAPSGS